MERKLLPEQTRAVAKRRLASLLAVVAGATSAGCSSGASSDPFFAEFDGGGTGQSSPDCPHGTDRDRDGYGLGCAQGGDCDDNSSASHPGAIEVCDGADNDCDGEIDEAVLNRCGTCALSCGEIGDGPFPIDPAQEPALLEADQVGLDANGDLVLDRTHREFNYLWISNTDDLGRGTVSKVDTIKLAEVARYYTVHCEASGGTTGCRDLHGQPIDAAFLHKPSRTAVDTNFDVWVANRAFFGQPSATKIANDPNDCVDRDKSGSIETSADHNGDGRINTDCNADGAADDAQTVCTGAFAGQLPEFVGVDDECVLFTANFGEPGDTGRSVCLSPTVDPGPSHAWIGTNEREINRYYRIDGNTGQIGGPFDMPAGHRPYGCAVDASGLLWSSDPWGGGMAYLNTAKPAEVSPKALLPPMVANAAFYGISVASTGGIWLGGWTSGHIYRYKPNRASFSTLAQGTWTAVKSPSGLGATRGIAADHRGKVWVAGQQGYIWRVEQGLPDGLHDLSSDLNYWQTPGATLIGVGVDFKGHVWGVAFEGNVASRLDVDAQGDVVQPPTAQTQTVIVGEHPYTYSDFTGFGLQNLGPPEGTYVYRYQPCNSLPARWQRVTWDASTQPNTSVSLFVRSGNSPEAMGPWQGPFTVSPADVGDSSAQPLSPNPAGIFDVKFVLRSGDRKATPVLKAFAVAYSCIPG